MMKADAAVDDIRRRFGYYSVQRGLMYMDSMNNKDVIEIRCRQCKKLMMNYHMCGDDSAVALQGIGVKCDRCKRVMILKKYTEGMLISRLIDGAFRI